MTTTTSTTSRSVRTPFSRALLGGLAAGAIAAIVGSLASLGLTSPDRVFFNTGSITLASLIAGLIAGLAWRAASDRPAAMRRFLLWIGIVLVVVVVGALAIEALPGHPVSHVATFIVPLAAIVLVLLAVLTPILARAAFRPMLAAPVAAIVAVVVGVAFISHGSGSGRLALPAPVAGPSSSPSADSAGVIRLKDVAGKAFAVVPGESKATYTVNEKLTQLPLPDDAVGSTGQVSGTIYLDGRPSTVAVDLKTFQSDQALRDRRAREDKPGLNNLAPAEFTISKLPDLPSEYKPGDTVSRNVQGTLKINNIEKPVTFAVEARLQDNTLSIHGATDFTWSDFQLQPPNYSFVQVNDKIHAEVLLVARSQ